MKTLLPLCAISSLALASAAFAMAPAPAPPPVAATPAAPVGGPPIPGVCTYNREYALGTSAVGKSTLERLKQLAAAVDAELKPEAEAIQSQGRAFEAMTPAQQQANAAQIAAFQQRYAALRAKTQTRKDELQATGGKHFGEIANLTGPIISQIITEKGCGILLERSPIYFANPQMDISDIVVQRLNAKISALPPFEREHADQQGVAPAPTPAAPAPAPAPTTTKKKK